MKKQTFKVIFLRLLSWVIKIRSVNEHVIQLDKVLIFNAPAFSNFAMQREISKLNF